MSTIHNAVLDILAQLVEDRPEGTCAGVAEDQHGTFCIYCGRRGWPPDRPRPDHRGDCPIPEGQQLLRRIYGDGD